MRKITTAYITPRALAVLPLLTLGALATSSRGYRDVTVHDLRAAQGRGAVILDVRTLAEYTAGHVPGARLLPLADLAGRLEEVPARQTIYVICRSGARSAQASALLARAGKKDVRNVTGGMNAWQAAGYPVKGGGRP